MFKTKIYTLLLLSLFIFAGHSVEAGKNHTTTEMKKQKIDTKQKSDTEKLQRIFEKNSLTLTSEQEEKSAFNEFKDYNLIIQSLLALKQKEMKKPLKWDKSKADSAEEFSHTLNTLISNYDKQIEDQNFRHQQRQQASEFAFQSMNTAVLADTGLPITTFAADHFGAARMLAFA
mgnify:CR=1 FL=1